MYFATKEFWIDAIERTVSTIAQTLIALASVSATDLVTLDWTAILIASALAGLIALAKAFAVGGITSDYVPERALDE